eukprot:scpid60486/ scgid12544/ 
MAQYRVQRTEATCRWHWQCVTATRHVSGSLSLRVVGAAAAEARTPCGRVAVCVPLSCCFDACVVGLSVIGSLSTSSANLNGRIESLPVADSACQLCFQYFDT